MTATPDTTPAPDTTTPNTTTPDATTTATDMVVEYQSNNSGGDWWLTTDQWKALEDAGWEVKWHEKPFLGALATSAVRRGLDRDDAIEEWEAVTGENCLAQGCECCGPPHYFFEGGDDEAE